MGDDAMPREEAIEAQLPPGAPEPPRGPLKIERGLTLERAPSLCFSLDEPREGKTERQRSCRREIGLEPCKGGQEMESQAGRGNLCRGNRARPDDLKLDLVGSKRGGGMERQEEQEENGASVWKYPLVLSEAKAKWKLIHHGSRMEASLESHLAFRLSSWSVPLTGNLNRGVRRATRQGAQLSSSLENVCHCRPPIGPRFGKVSTGEFPHTGRHFVDAIMPCNRKGQSGQDRQPG